MEQNAKEDYDFVIIGTGLTETALSSIISMRKKYKILHIDKNSTYGSEFSTMQYSQLENHFKRPYGTIDPELASKDRQFNIDITPKLLLQDSKMKDFLVENEIHELVNFTSIKGSYIFSNKLHSIPRNETQSITSSAISMMQKPKAIKFFWHARAFFKENNIKTKDTMREEFESFSLNQDTQDFIGHAIALNLDDKYLDEHPSKTYDRIVRYVSSIVSYEGTESPYIYPLYGLSELCQSFSRRAALNGVTFMLNACINKIEGNNIELADPDGIAHKITAGKIIADPQYFKSSRVYKKIIRCIMILEKEKKEARNIIFLKRSFNRKNDVFCVILGSTEMACPAGYEIGILSTVQETNEKPEVEMADVLSKFKIVKKYIEVRDLLENDDTENIIFTKAVDESAIMDNIYDDIERISSMIK